MAKKQPVDKGRRRFIKLSVLGGSGLVLGMYLGFGGEHNPSPVESWQPGPKEWTPNAWLQIGPDGLVTVRVNHTEMGQGVSTGLPTILADELDAAWDQIRFEIAPVEDVYKNPANGIQMTGGSTSTPTSWNILRQAGAAARQMLIAAAAQRWSVHSSQCGAHKGYVIHTPTSRKLGYGELAAAAAKMEIPSEIKLKDPRDFDLIGTNPPRLDIPEKIEGKAVYGIDITLPGMFTATVIHPPVFGDTLKSFDDSQARALPGVRRVLAIESGIAVVADTFWQAQKGVKALKIEWADGGSRGMSNQSIWRRWEALAVSDDGEELHAEGDFDQALAGSAKTISAVYKLPWQAHACPEPMNCTAHVEPDRCRVWAPTQMQGGAMELVGRLTGLPHAKIDIITPYVGGAFGRRAWLDYVQQAVEISQAMGAPVKVIWTREEDIEHDTYRPASYNLLQAGLDSKGNPLAWSMRIVGPDENSIQIPPIMPAILPHWVPRALRNAAGWAARQAAPGLMEGMGVKQGAAPLHYAIDNFRLDYVHDNPGVMVGFWRSVGSSSNAFVVECFMDEIAAASGQDPVAMRLKLTKEKSPRMHKVLALAAEKAGWGKNPDPGVFQGAAVHEFHNTIVAMIADISIARGSDITVHRVTCAVDCGRVINPNNVRDQISGGIAFGLTAALKGEITIKGGRVEQSNLHDFPLLTMSEMPEVHVHLVKSSDPPLGIGEPGVPPIAPAVANAVFAATGKRLRRLPLRL